MLWNNAAQKNASFDNLLNMGDGITMPSKVVTPYYLEFYFRRF